MEQFNFDLGGMSPTEARPGRETPSRQSPAGNHVHVPAAELVVGTEVRDIYLVSTKEVRTTKAGKPYLKLRMSDRSGAVDCMVWENAERVGARFQAGDLVVVCARVSEYEGRPQLEASVIEPAASGAADPRDYLPCTYRDIEELKGFLRFHVDSVYDRDYSTLLHSFFSDQAFMDSFATAPAAKHFHHAYLGGLLEHTVSVASLCESSSQQYSRVNRDLLVTSALLHDIGKVEELTYEKAIDYSDAGRFLGHVLLGVSMVRDHIRQSPGFPEEKEQLLLHAIASHHGELEWGSPKRPKTIEALILHHVDNLDAKAKGFLEIVEGSRNAQWTDLRNLFRRPLHIPRASHQEEGFLPPSEDDSLNGPM
ncbi:MAG: HD domain-containing protein [Gaiellales bacterium]|nr:HD domain-containing protein [Gaiellales bacterium]